MLLSLYSTILVRFIFSEIISNSVWVIFCLDPILGIPLPLLTLCYLLKSFNIYIYCSFLSLPRVTRQHPSAIQMLFLLLEPSFLFSLPAHFYFPFRDQRNIISKLYISLVLQMSSVSYIMLLAPIKIIITLLIIYLMSLVT